MKRIFILHGWSVRLDGGNREKWQVFLDELASFGLEPIFLNIPGLSAPLNEVWNLSNFVSWLDDELSDYTTDSQQVILLGHSFGGQLVSKYTAVYQDKVERLILLDSAGIRDMAFKAVVKRTAFLFLAKLGGFLSNSERLRNLIYRIARESDYKNAPPLLRRTMSKILDDEVKNDFMKITCPTQIIWGEFDKVTPVKQAYLINRLVKNSSLQFIKDARHSPQFTHPKEVAKVVNDFIDN